MISFHHTTKTDDKKYRLPAIGLGVLFMIMLTASFFLFLFFGANREKELRQYLDSEVPYYFGENYVSLEKAGDFRFPLLSYLNGDTEVYGHAFVYRLTLKSGKTAYAGWGGINDMIMYNVDEFETPELFAKHLIYLVAVNAEQGDPPRFENISVEVEGALNIPKEWRDWRQYDDTSK